MGNEFTDILRVTGLSRTESEVYLAALELGPSSVWDISKKSGVKRPTCYVVLEEMLERSIAKEHNDGKRTIYSVISPKQLAVIEEKKHSKFQTILPELEGMASRSHMKPKVSVFEGENGIMEVYNMMLNLSSDSELLVYGNAEIKHSYGQFIKDFLKQKCDKNIRTRTILPDTSENKKASLKDFLEKRETRFLPNKMYRQTTEVNIFGDSIAYIAHSEIIPFATVMENARLAFEERQRFNLLWELAMKVEIPKN